MWWGDLLQLNIPPLVPSPKTMENKDKQTLEVSSSKEGWCSHWLSSALCSCLRCHLQISVTPCDVRVFVSVCLSVGVWVCVHVPVCLCVSVKHLCQGAYPDGSDVPQSCPFQHRPAPEERWDSREMVDSRREQAEGTKFGGLLRQ